MTGPSPNPQPANAAVPDAPQKGIRITVGGGKTQAAIKQIVAILALDPAARIAVFVPDHALAEEMKRRIEAAVGAVVFVMVWRGREQADPGSSTAARMCERHADVRTVQEAGGVGSDVCGTSPGVPLFCRFHPGAGGTCGYIAQGAQPLQAKIFIMPHAMLAGDAPAPLRRFASGVGGPGGIPSIAAADFVVIDEAFHSAMIAKRDGVSLSVADPATLPAIPDRKKSGIPGMADRFTRETVTRLHAVLRAAGAGERISKATLIAAGLSQSACWDAWDGVRRLRKTLPRAKLAAARPGTAKRVLGNLARTNGRAVALAQVLAVTARILGADLGAAALRVFDNKGGREIALHWRKPISDDWLKAKHGILLLDATMQEALVLPWLPGLTIEASSPVAAPNMHVVQITDKDLPLTSLGVGSYARHAAKSAGLTAQTTPPAPSATAALRDVGRLVDTLAHVFQGQGARGGPDVLLVAPKDAVAKLSSAGAIPANVGTLHFGKLRGQDEFRGVAALVVASRLLPHPSALEDLADIVFAQGITRLPASAEFYDRVPCLREMTGGVGKQAERWAHPDPGVEALRWNICEGEIIQAVGRGRGIHRTTADPLTVFLLTSTPIPGLPVDEAVTRDELFGLLARGTMAMLRLGVFPLDWPGRGVLLTRSGVLAPRNRKRPKRTAREWFPRNAADQAFLVEAEGALTGKSRMGRVSLKVLSLLGNTAHSHIFGLSPPLGRSAPQPPRWNAFTYRRVGERKAGHVLVRPDQTDPRASVEAALGALADFAPAMAPGAQVPKRPRGRPPGVGRPVRGAPGITPPAAAPPPEPGPAPASPVLSPAPAPCTASLAPSHPSLTPGPPPASPVLLPPPAPCTASLAPFVGAARRQ